MKRSTALLAATALFLVGILVGVLGTHLFYFHEMRQPGGLARLGSRLMLANLDRELDLTAEQRRAVEGILADARSEFAEIRRAATPRALAVLDRSHERIAALLSAEQRAKFERIQARRRALLERYLEGR